MESDVVTNLGLQGLFDPIAAQAVTQLTDPTVVHGAAHVQLAHEAAVQSLVLSGLLPSITHAC